MVNNKTTAPADDQIDLLEVGRQLLHHWWILAICAVVGAVASLLVTIFFITPQYTSNGALYVSSSTTTVEITQGTLTASAQLAETYAEILQRRSFLETISNSMNGKYSAAQIGEMLTVQPINETELLEVTVTSEDAFDSYWITEQILENAQEELLDIIKSGSVEIVDEAVLPTAPSSPSVKKNTLLGFIGGAVASAAVILILHMLDTRVHSADEVRTRFKQPVLGEIPDWEKLDTK